MLFCRFCGKQIVDDSVFCPYCGKSLDEKEKEASQIKKEIPIIRVGSTTKGTDYDNYKKRANSFSTHLNYELDLNIF